MEWQDEGLLLRTQPHGESNVIATFFTCFHGLINGYIRINKKYPLQQGNLYHIKRKARLTSHLGLFTVEQHEEFPSLISAALTSPVKLACINSIRTLLITSLIDQDAGTDFYARLKHHIKEICLYSNLGHYALFEKDLLTHCGFGLDLSRCAVTNLQENLTYVSPKTGRAVTENVGSPYKAQLFSLPTPLYKPEKMEWTSMDILESLKITGYFLERMLHEHLHRKMPSERDYLLDPILKRHLKVL